MGCVGALYTDAQLVELYKASKTLAEARAHVESLFARYENRVIAWCIKLTGNREDATDLAQDIFLKAFRGLADFRAQSTFARWLYQIARNHCINFLQRTRPNSPDQLEGTALLSLDDKHWKSISDGIDKKEILIAFSKVLDSELNALERKVLYLHFADGLKLPEINHLLRLTNKSGAKAYLVSAKRKVQRRMGSWLSSRRIKVSHVL